MNTHTPLFRCVVIADLHYARLPNAGIPARRGELAPALLRAAFSFYGKSPPDIFLIAGDCLNDPADPEAEFLLCELATVFRSAPAPVLAIPGNHDPAAENFYAWTNCAPRPVDVKNFRIVPFPDDPEIPGYNARRTPAGLAAMRQAAKDWQGPLIALQHVPLYPECMDAARYHYDNADEIVRCMEECGYVLSISGHQHEGASEKLCRGMRFLTAPALAEAPFPSMELLLDPESGWIHRIHPHEDSVASMLETPARKKENA